MPSSPKVAYEPHDAWIQDDEWMGIDLIFMDDQLIGTRLAVAGPTLPVSKLQVSIPKAELLITVTRGLYGDEFESVAESIVEAAIFSLREVFERDGRPFSEALGRSRA